jgi:TrmH family RNA methyltransferase
MPLITSTANLAIRRIRALRQRKARTESGLFLVEGIRLVTAAVECGAEIETVIVAPALLTSTVARAATEQARARGAGYLEVSPEVFGSLSGKEGPQGLAAVVHQRWYELAEIDPTGDFCWVALEAAQDPGNVGTILRTADAVGASGLILLGHSTDPHDPAALRASMGAIFSQRLVRASAEEFVAWSLAHRLMLIGTSDAARQAYQAIRYQPPVVLLMGSERQGLSEDLQRICTAVVSIPMVGRSDSLNLAVATGVTLYEIFNQQHRD